MHVFLLSNDLWLLSVINVIKINKNKSEKRTPITQVNAKSLKINFPILLRRTFV